MGNPEISIRMSAVMFDASEAAVKDYLKKRVNSFSIISWFNSVHVGTPQSFSYKHVRTENNEWSLATGDRWNRKNIWSM